MKLTHKKPIVLERCKARSDLLRFKDNNKVLDSINKDLEKYLDTKRAKFPRFCFLSPDELIQILSESRNPHAVQPHLKKCFDNMNKIIFTEEEDSKKIIAMVSTQPEDDPETVNFSESVMAEGPVESWMNSIQSIMQKSLYDQTKDCMLKYPENALERNEWFFIYPSQSVLVID